MRPFPAPPIAPLTTCKPEFLFLVNGQDDNGNGLIDEGWDGLDDDLVKGVDDVLEWENETWLGRPKHLVDDPPRSRVRQPAEPALHDRRGVPCRHLMPARSSCHRTW